MRDKITFLFGAGADHSYGIPVGSEYIESTVLKKNTDMYNALSEFYERRIDKEYCNPYSRNYLFRSDSTDLRKIICGAYLNFKQDASRNQETERKILDAFEEQERKEIEDEKYERADIEDKRYVDLFSGIAQQIYKIVIDPPKTKESAEKESDENEKVEYFYHHVVKKYLEHHGVVEKYFSTIINPKRIGPENFWKIVNYFWSAFFCIYQGMTEISEDYSEVLNDLKKL